MGILTKISFVASLLVVSAGLSGCSPAQLNQALGVGAAAAPVACATLSTPAKVAACNQAVAAGLAIAAATNN